MEIKTKYEIGTHIWVIYENNGEICLYDDYIEEIAVGKDGYVYILKTACEEIKEEEIILYEEKEKLYDTIYKMMETINKKEEEK